MDAETHPEGNQSPQLPSVPDDGIHQTEDKPYAQAARGRLAVLPFSLGLIGLGAFLLARPEIEGVNLNAQTLGVLFGAVWVLSTLLRFFATGRRERGLLYLALILLSIGGLFGAAVVSDGALDLTAWWPLLLLSAALSLVVTFILERQHEAGLLTLALFLGVSGGSALLVTQDVLQVDFLERLEDYFPLLIALGGVLLIPLAMRGSAE
ncbi:MAG: hypothetical protein HC915_08900 [Anaerolineae bacterium]|nr:hypothetical protein [Anaerolineae bacterium]